MLKTEIWKNVFYGKFVKNIWNKFELESQRKIDSRFLRNFNKFP